MNVRNWVYSGTRKKDASEIEKANDKLARELAAEGIVLLKNENILPLDSEKAIALLGCGAEKTVKGGIGSGDVNNRDSISIYEGMKEAGVFITSESWIEDYRERYKEAREVWKNKILEDAKKFDNPFDAYASNPFSMPEGRNITSEDLENAAVAIYVVSRISGEGKDRRKVAGDYYLSQEEQRDLLFLDKEQIPTVLLINAGGVVELTDILERTSCIKGILNISQLGQSGGRAVADVLLGKVSPSGRLTATWAKRYEDYPMAESFGYLNGNLEQEEYREGIFVGYRYFDTFQVPVLFPFGYGLSYTTFHTEFEDLKLTDDGMEVIISVENTGEQYFGKEVVQLYLEFPKGENREHHRLIGFCKTKCLRPKEVQKIKICVEAKSLASFSEKEHAWIIKEDSYGLCIGEHINSLQTVATLKVSKKIVIEDTKKLQNPCAEFPSLDMGVENLDKEAQDDMDCESRELPVYLFEAQKIAEKKINIQYAEEQTVEELIPLLYGNITKGASMLGSAGIRVPGSAGETTEMLEDSYGKRSLIMADGPAGIRLRQSYEVDQETGKIYGTGVLGSLENGCLDNYVEHEHADTYYQYCTAFPVGTVIAQTWNTELAITFGKAVSKEMEEFHIDLWLAPGMNIHRNPLCGRNFEYFSEDPLVAGMMAAAVTKGVQSSNHCGVTVKHFACNNQEDHRMGVNVCISERALREIYLRGFEIAVRKSAPVALMTSYNRINGIYAANNYDLCTTIARGEWGFEGIIMSDWNTTVPEDGSIPWKCAVAGNDIIMPGNTNDDQNIREAYEKGMISEQTIRESAGRILKTIEKLSR